jgi:hypothetical protein
MVFEIRNDLHGTRESNIKEKTKRTSKRKIEINREDKARSHPDP